MTHAGAVTQLIYQYAMALQLTQSSPVVLGLGRLTLFCLGFVVDATGPDRVDATDVVVEVVGVLTQPNGRALMDAISGEAIAWPDGVGPGPRHSDAPWACKVLLNTN